MRNKMSIEEHLIQVIGISCIIYWSLRTLIISAIRAYKEVVINLHQSVKEIQESTQDDKLEYELERMK